jgi:hypothetical protein
MGNRRPRPLIAPPRIIEASEKLDLDHLFSRRKLSRRKSSRRKSLLKTRDRDNLGGNVREKVTPRACQSIAASHSQLAARGYQAPRRESAICSPSSVQLAFKPYQPSGKGASRKGSNNSCRGPFSSQTANLLFAPPYMETPA